MTRAQVTTPAVLLAWVVAAIALSRHGDTVLLLDMAAMGRALSATLLLASGALFVVRWRLAGSAPTGWAGVALVLFGAGLPALTVPGTALYGDTLLASLDPAGRITLVLMVLFLLIATQDAVSTPEPFRPLRMACLALCALVGALLLLVVAARAGVMNVGSPLLSASGEWLICFGWLLLAVRSRRRVPTLPVTAVLLMAGSEAVRGFGYRQVQPAWTISTGFQLAAAVVIVSAAGAGLWAALVTADHRLGEFARTAHQACCERDAAVALERERAHDARSVISGVLAALRLVCEDGDATRSHATGQRLLPTVHAELERLENLLDPDSSEPVRDFTLRPALDPVLCTQALAGAPLRIDLPPGVRVRGRPAATATALASVLDNARRHAPGAAVHVHAELREALCVVHVDDAGPGIPTVERAVVLRRGVRGCTTRAAGSGLGLYAAARLINDQGGELRLGVSPLGGTRVTVTVPLAAPVESSGDTPRLRLIG